MILFSILQQINSVCRSLAGNVSGSHINILFYLILPLLCIWLVLCLFLKKRHWFPSKKIRQIKWKSVVFHFYFSLLCHLPRFVRFLWILFHPPTYTLLWERQMQWGRWGQFSLSIFPKLGVLCCWPIKENYDRIMSQRAELCGRGKAHVISQHAVGKQSQNI